MEQPSSDLQTTPQVPEARDYAKEKVGTLAFTTLEPLPLGLSGLAPERQPPCLLLVPPSLNLSPLEFHWNSLQLEKRPEKGCQALA